ncbi:hypothetical protein GBF38_021124 [Nibea albiflora]|uniref:Uncharacterized protein n=1 Tax=Nibea albiflora TaxID=240163 RepID=A0ACB7FFF7_NIBAL|nr:hypothetical protein GBF38_021124 [Nibea albiflora]
MKQKNQDQTEGRNHAEDSPPSVLIELLKNISVLHFVCLIMEKENHVSMSFWTTWSTEASPHGLLRLHWSSGFMSGHKGSFRSRSLLKMVQWGRTPTANVETWDRTPAQPETTIEGTKKQVKSKSFRFVFRVSEKKDIRDVLVHSCLQAGTPAGAKRGVKRRKERSNERSEERSKERSKERSEEEQREERRGAKRGAKRSKERSEEEQREERRGAKRGVKRSKERSNERSEERSKERSNERSEERSKERSKESLLSVMIDELIRFHEDTEHLNSSPTSAPVDRYVSRNRRRPSSNSNKQKPLMLHVVAGGWIVCEDGAECGKHLAERSSELC